MGKGDDRRPCFIPKEEYDANYEAIFGKKRLNVVSDEDRREMEQDLREMTHDPCCGCPVCLSDLYDQHRTAGGDIPDDEHDGRDVHAEGSVPSEGDSP